MTNRFSSLWLRFLSLFSKPKPRSLAESLMLNHREDTLLLLDRLLQNGAYTSMVRVIPPHVMTVLIQSREIPWIDKVSMINSGKLLPEAFEDAVEDMSLISVVARSEHAPASLLARLATGADWHAKDQVARNPACPEEALVMLSTDESFLVRESVASNLGTPIAILRLLANDASIAVRAGVAKNSKTPEETRAFLTKDTSKVVAGLADRSIKPSEVPYIQGRLANA